MTAVPAEAPVVDSSPASRAGFSVFRLFARLRASVLSWGVADGQPRGLLAVIVGVDALGLFGALLVATVLGGTGGPDRWSVAVGLLCLTALGELTAVRLRHGESTEELTLFEAAVVVDVLLLSPAVAVVVPVLGLALATLARRRPVVKAAFNLGTYALSTVVMVVTFRLVAGGAAPFAARSVLGLCLGTAAFAAVNLLCLARVLAVVEDVPVREVLTDGWQLSGIMAVGNVALGTVVVAIGQFAPTLLPFTALPAVALTFAYRSAASRSDERDRAARLLDLSQALVGRLDAEELVASFLTSARRAFRADRARVVLDVGITAWPVVVEVDAGGVLRRPATTADVALLERPARGQAAMLVGDVLPEAWAQALIAPLEAEGLRLGVLALASDSRGQLTVQDAALLTPLASALGVALRGAEHLERVVEETSKLKVVVDHSSDGIFVVDGGGRVLLWNPAMSAVTGVAVDEAHGMLSELVQMRDTDGQPVDPLAAAFALTPEEPRQDVEMAIVRPDGEERWVRCAHAGLFDDGRLVRDVVIVHDVTRQREVERLKADFIATVSHELRTPVTPIKGYADLLRRRGDQMTLEKRNECLDIIGDRVNHLARLVEDLLLASRISSPRTPTNDVTLATADLVSLTKRAAGDFTSDAARVNLLLPEAPIVVSCDPMRVVQVVGNLISNALKYSPGTSQVDVAISAYDGRARVSVTDRGRGIPADQLEAVFDKFHRVEDPLTMTTSGTGLGLYIARQLARAMDGDVVVRSTLGHGSVFVLILPLAETVATPSVVSAAPAVRSAAPVSSPGLAPMSMAGATPVAAPVGVPVAVPASAVAGSGAAGAAGTAGAASAAALARVVAASPAAAVRMPTARAALQSPERPSVSR
jgi:PAS domain S-box-containing protein